MAESEADLPPQGADLATWQKARLAAARSVLRAKGWLASLAGSRSVARLRVAARNVGSPAMRAKLRAGFGRFLPSLLATASNEPVRNRYALHLIVVCLAVGIVVISHVHVPRIGALLPESSPPPETTGSVITETLSGTGAGRVYDASAALIPVPVAHTTAAERERTAVITYTVQTNDNLWAISQNFGLQVETLLWANSGVETNPDLLSVNDVLVIPPVDGVYYTVQKGDTVEKLAKTFKTTAERIISFEGNGLEQPYALVAGQKLMLPGGQKPVPVYQSIYPMTYVGSAPKGAPKGTGRFAWPTRGTLTQRFWSRHYGIDIANRIGAAIYAADDGYVVMAGLDTWGYGNQVVIDHGNGYWTRYAHLDKILVTAGDTVKKNQRIANMGNTGRSTGPHLHFEVIYKKTQRDPLSYLP